jgi:hypothetical protein
MRDRMRGVVKIEYSLEAKVAMVMKAQHTVSRGRVEFDASWIDLQSAFLTIKKALTGSGRAITFKASRNEQTGHADLAWAAMHIFINEPLDGNARPKTRMEMIGGEEDGDIGADHGEDASGAGFGPYGAWRRSRPQQRRELRFRRSGAPRAVGADHLARDDRPVARLPAEIARQDQVLAV